MSQVQIVPLMLFLYTKYIKEGHKELIAKYKKDSINKFNYYYNYYLDPPYFATCNTFYPFIESVDSDMNAIDSTYMFVYFVEYLRTAKCKVILVINHNSLSVESYKPFIRLVYDKNVHSVIKVLK